MSRKILVVEDEEAIREFIVINLERSGYEVRGVISGEEGIAAFEQEVTGFDVAVLDIMLPGIDGFAVCKKLREQSPTLGIIMLSARGQEMDKVRGLMLGADDYITKPFSPGELVARVDALARRVAMLSDRSGSTGEELVSGPFRLNLKSRSLTKSGKPIALTQVEFQLMEYFLNHENVALDRGEILEAVWGKNYFGDVKIVDVNIRRLRLKLEEDPSEPRYLLTVRGMGYKWNG